VKSDEKLHLPRDAYLRLLVLGHVDDVDPVDEDVLQAATEVRNRWEVGHIGLNHSADIHLGEYQQRNKLDKCTYMINGILYSKAHMYLLVVLKKTLIN
jgi:hypothetical protein